MAPCWAPVPFHGFDQARKDGVAVDFPSPERLSNKKSDEPRLTEFEEIRKSMKYIVLGYFPETFETSCSEVLDAVRDTSSCGYERNDQAAASSDGERIPNDEGGDERKNQYHRGGWRDGRLCFSIGLTPVSMRTGGNCANGGPRCRSLAI